MGFNSSGVENRGRSAVDIALWDLLGQASNQPIYQLLGGASRDRIQVYNTCAGYGYIRALPDTAGLSVENWGVDTAYNDAGPYEDLRAFLTDAGTLAKSLLAQGVGAMKIWPFDLYVPASGGHYISRADLKKGIEPFQKIRDAVGDAMEIMVELHSLWNLPSCDQDRHGTGGVRARLVRGPDQDGRPRLAAPVLGCDECAHRGE